MDVCHGGDGCLLAQVASAERWGFDGYAMSQPAGRRLQVGVHESAVDDQRRAGDV
jgi:hypothetical protein